MVNYLVAIGLILSACSPQYVSEKELVEYINNEYNGLVKKKTANGMELTVTYRPTDLLVAQEVGSSVDTVLIRKAMNKYSEYAYFILSLTAEGKNALYGKSHDMSNFSDNLQTLSFRMADRVFLSNSDNDTIPVADYIFDRSFGMGSTTLMFVFNNEKLRDCNLFTLHLREFGMHTGDQRFPFHCRDIRKMPKLEQYKKFDRLHSQLELKAFEPFQ